MADTDSTGYCATTGGSRVTFATGMAVIRACEDVIGQLKRRAAATWDIDAEQVEWSNGEARPAPGVKRRRAASDTGGIGKETPHVPAARFPVALR